MATISKRTQISIRVETHEITVIRFRARRRNESRQAEDADVFAYQTEEAMPATNVLAASPDAQPIEEENYERNE